MRLSAEGRDVVAQVTGAREQQQLTDIIRESRREAGETGPGADDTAGTGACVAGQQNPPSA
ncbi:Uncharacterised protein [Escherichia coli]|uniref:TraI N-terminal subdomain domain-containing protein n=1 Tax=Escherichia coli TaxID=562 RepID=A0A376TXJ8_ECOLX|nr:Uncharacterised protein [Escherichia coli]